MTALLGHAGAVHRIGWHDVPHDVRHALEHALGAAVDRVHPVTGGFSPCLAGAAELGDGRRVFVKAVSPRQNPETPGMLRRELAITASLPAEVPAPSVLAVVDEGEWIAGAFEHVPGAPPTLPWDAAALDRALAAVLALAQFPAPAGLPTARQRLTPLFRGWRTLRDVGTIPEGWWIDRIDELVALEERALAALEGDRMVHNDIRADNMIVRPDGEVVFVDWAHPAAGPAWLDIVLWLPALELEGGGKPEAVLERVAPLDVDAEDLAAVVAACAGYFLERGTLPDPPGLPTVRAFQRAQAATSLAWLARLLSRAE